MNERPDRDPRRNVGCWGLIGALALIATIEHQVSRDPEFLGNVAASWRFKDRHIADLARGRDILCFGDSQVQFGVLPRVVQERTGRRAYNLAIYSGPAPASYFLLRRALESGARPTLVVADFARIILADGPASPVRLYPWAELLDTREAAELAWAARDPDLLASIAVRALLPSLRGRFEVRASVRAALDGRETEQRRTIRGLRRNWTIVAGAQLNPPAADFRDIPTRPGEFHLAGTWRCDPVNRLYLEKFLDLAARHAIGVVWLLPPVSPGAQAACENQGDEELYLALVRTIQARHANLTVVDARHSGFGRDYFHDVAHLDRDGAIALSNALGDCLGALRAEPGPRPRWVALPAPGRCTTGAPIEDVGTSRAMTDRSPAVSVLR